MGSLQFVKYEGLGNDFIVVDAAEPDFVSPDLARRLCDRHLGIGADGVLVVSPAKAEDARAHMRVTNADGSRPEMCGNGLRCVALHLATLDSLTHASQVVETDAGPRECDVERNGQSARVRATMGKAAPLDEIAIEVEGRTLSFARLSLGNPHAVLFEAAFDEQQIDSISEQVSRSVRGGTNVEFVTQRDDRLDVVVWERGVGRTRACGTGAVASVAVAALANRVPFGELVTVRLPGGALSVSVDQASLATALVGPARRVFEGVFSP